MERCLRILPVALTLVALALPVAAADFPAPTEGDFVVRDFRFGDGETLPTLNLHYRTIGTPRRDASGVVRNAVMILHGAGLMEKFMSRVKHGRYVLIPTSDQTRGHGTHSLPTVWGSYLAELLRELGPAMSQ